jgi:hypothetical protein
MMVRHLRVGDRLPDWTRLKPVLRAAHSFGGGATGVVGGGVVRGGGGGM